jgi:hypothetical protein
MKGQVTIDAALGLGAIMVAAIGGIILLLGCLGHLLLVKWAAETSRCIAQGTPSLICGKLSAHRLGQSFAFHDVVVRSRVQNEVIHTFISGKLAGRTVAGEYDLFPSEYKRVAR